MNDDQENQEDEYDEPYVAPTMYGSQNELVYDEPNLKWLNVIAVILLIVVVAVLAIWKFFINDCQQYLTNHGSLVTMDQYPPENCRVTIYPASDKSLLTSVSIQQYDAQVNAFAESVDPTDPIADTTLAYYTENIDMLSSYMYASRPDDTPARVLALQNFEQLWNTQSQGRGIKIGTSNGVTNIDITGGPQFSNYTSPNAVYAWLKSVKSGAVIPLYPSSAGQSFAYITAQGTTGFSTIWPVPEDTYELDVLMRVDSPDGPMADSFRYVLDLHTQSNPQNALIGMPSNGRGWAFTIVDTAPQNPYVVGQVIYLTQQYADSGTHRPELAWMAATVTKILDPEVVAVQLANGETIEALSVYWTSPTKGQ